MKKQDRELFLKDLCARLPYGVECEIRQREGCSPVLYDKLTLGTIKGVQEYGWCVKTYLRPMSSMTEKEKNEYEGFFPCNEDTIDYALDYALEHHLDYRGLIPLGLALPAPEGMYNF